MPTGHSQATFNTSNLDSFLGPEMAELSGLVFLSTSWRGSTEESSEQAAHSGLPASKSLREFQ